MKVIKNDELKNFIYDLMLHEDDLDENGNHLRRRSFSKKYYKSYRLLMDKLQKVMDCILISKEKNAKGISDEDLVYVSYDYLSENKQNLLRENRYLGDVFRDGKELEITDEEIDMIRFYYSDRKELKLIDLKAFEEFEELIK